MSCGSRWLRCHASMAFAQNSTLLGRARPSLDVQMHGPASILVHLAAHQLVGSRCASLLALVSRCNQCGRD